MERYGILIIWDVQFIKTNVIILLNILKHYTLERLRTLELATLKVSLFWKKQYAAKFLKHS